MMDGWYGDEPEIDAEEKQRKEEYYDEHADDWKYNDDE